MNEQLNNTTTCDTCQPCYPNVKIDKIEEGMTGKEVADLLYDNFDKLNKSKANKCVERKVRNIIKGENKVYNETAKNAFINKVFYTWSKKDYNNTIDYVLNNAPSIEVGTTTTLPAGSQATVTYTKDGRDAVLNFGIPKGDKGDQGIKGDSGVQLGDIVLSQELGNGEDVTVSQKTITQEFESRPLLDSFSIKPNGDFSSFEEILQAIPIEKRKPHCMLLYRINGGTPFLAIYQSKFTEDTNWYDTSLWFHVAFTTELQQLSMNTFTKTYNSNDRDYLFNNGIYKHVDGAYIMFVTVNLNIVYQTEIGQLYNNNGVLIRSRFYNVDTSVWEDWKEVNSYLLFSLSSDNLFKGSYGTDDRDTKFETGIYWSTFGGYILCVQKSTNPTETGIVRQTELGNLSNSQGILLRSRTYNPDTTSWGDWEDFGELLNGFNKNVSAIAANAAANVSINYPLIDIDNLLDGYISTGSGLHRTDEEAMSNYPASKCTSKIPVVGGMSYFISGTNGRGCAGYDKDGNLVPPIEGQDTYTLVNGEANKIASNVVAIQFTVNLDKTYDDYKDALIKPIIENNEIQYSGALVTAVIPVLLEYILKQKNEYPNAVVRKISDSEINIYMKIHSNYYGRFRIVKTLNESANVDYWRLTDSYLCSYSGGGFTQIHNLLLRNENEYVFGINGASDSTGGYHGDEKFTDMYFLIDNKKYNPSDIPNSLNCKNVEYREVSSMYGNAAGDENVIATHYKITTFKNCGYTTRNRVTFAKDLTLNTAYGGLVCVHKDVGKYWTADDNIIREATGSGEDTRVFNKVIHPVVRYWNDTTGLSCTVDSHILYGMDNDLFYLSIWDRGNPDNDTKYYHRGKVNVTANQDYMTECNVMFDYNA